MEEIYTMPLIREHHCNTDFHASIPRGGGVAGKHGLGQQRHADLCEFAVLLLLRKSR